MYKKRINIRISIAINIQYLHIGGMEKKCLYCDELLDGRIDKKFCNPYCKTAYHYQKNKDTEDSFYKKVDKQLKLNRRILKEFNKAGKSMVRREKLHEAGFDPNYFTHYWKNEENQVYLFCYEFGFLKTQDNRKNKYLLIQWQSYMNK